MTYSEFTIYAADSHKMAIVRGEPKGFFVAFGFHDSGNFLASYQKPSRTYKTLASAERAARRWVA